MSDIKLACDVVEQVKTICDKHGNNAGELINILHEAQHLHGYLPEEMQRIIASKLRIPVSKVYGVVTFYTFFTMTPKGKHPISVCMGTACYVRGSEKLLEEFAGLPALRRRLRTGSGSDDRRKGVRTTATGGCKEDYRGTGISLPRPSKEDVTYRVSDMSRIFFGVISPLHINRSPGKSRTECGKYQIIAFLQFFLKIPDAERKRAGTGVAITFDVDHHFLGRYFESLRHSGNDTLVSLMRNHPVNLFLSQMVSGDNSFTGIRHIRYGILEHRAAFLINIMQMMIQ